MRTKTVNKAKIVLNITSSKSLVTKHHDSHHAVSSVYRFKGINGCEPIGIISNGAFGQVWLVRMNDIDHNQEAALKVFYSGDFMLECERERAILQHITMHGKRTGKPLQIAHIREDIEGVECPNLMLEYIHGFDLNHKVLKQYTFSLLFGFVKHMIEQIGNILNHLHSMNIYHNDLKPANIMFHPDKHLFYLIDFGLAVPLSLLMRFCIQSR